MKNIRKFTIMVLIILISLPVFFSCKKGPGDPFFSFYTRKQRLTGDWKVTKIDETVTFKHATITTSFDGTHKKVDLVVTDTTVYTANDTLYVYRQTQSAVGSLFYKFNKDGTYQIDEAFTDDTMPHFQYILQKKGLWFFTGGGRDSDTKTKELLGLQSTSYIYNPVSNSSAAYTWTYTGQNVMDIYHIYKLASKEIDLYYDVDETQNLYEVKTDLKMTLTPK